LSNNANQWQKKAFVYADDELKPWELGTEFNNGIQRLIITNCSLKRRLKSM